jgi:hypothetical protein
MAEGQISPPVLSLGLKVAQIYHSTPRSASRERERERESGD